MIVFSKREGPSFLWLKIWNNSLKNKKAFAFAELLLFSKPLFGVNLFKAKIKSDLKQIFKSVNGSGWIAVNEHVFFKQKKNPTHVEKSTIQPNSW